MRNVYHCTPSELDEQDNEVIEFHKQILALESKKSRKDSKMEDMKKRHRS